MAVIAVTALTCRKVLPFALSECSGPFNVAVVPVPHLAWDMLRAASLHGQRFETYQTHAAARAQLASECSVRGMRKPSLVWMATVHRSWDPVRREMIEPDAARVAKRAVATPQHVVDMVHDVGGHPAEPIRGGVQRVGAKNRFHVRVAGGANTALMTPRRMVRACPAGCWAVERYRLGREELFACHLVDGVSFEGVSMFLAGQLELGGEANRGE